MLKWGGKSVDKNTNSKIKIASKEPVGMHGSSETRPVQIWPVQSVPSGMHHIVSYVTVLYVSDNYVWCLHSEQVIILFSPCKQTQYLKEVVKVGSVVPTFCARYVLWYTLFNQCSLLLTAVFFSTAQMSSYAPALSSITNTAHMRR